MKLLTCLTFSIYFVVSTAWQLDSRCFRRLQEGIDMQDEEDVGMDIDTTENLVSSNSTTMTTTRHLQGDEKHNRELQSSSFQLKMYWQEGYCWQEEWIERRWCMSCQGRLCENGEQLWLRACNAADSTQKFNYLPVDGSGGGQLQTATANLCLNRVTESRYHLATCMSTQETQIFVGITANGNPFELRPMENPNLCLVNLDHHPRPKELIYSINCAHARLDHTSQWTVLNNNMDSFLSSTTSSSSTPNGATLRLRKPACSTTRPCNVCQGECYSDAMCTGRLECVPSDGINPLSGCTGVGMAGKSYCHLPLTQ
jgi:hypothetical protein